MTILTKNIASPILKHIHGKLQHQILRLQFCFISEDISPSVILGPEFDIDELIQTRTKALDIGRILEMFTRRNKFH